MSDNDIYHNSDYLARHPEMLEELEDMTPATQSERLVDSTDINAYLWAGTFNIWNEKGTIEQYYNTYAITNDGLVAGLMDPRPQSPYAILSEFGDIAIQIMRLDRWEQYEDMWRDALTAALENCNG